MTTCARCRAEVGDAAHCPRCGQAVLSPQAPRPAESAPVAAGPPPPSADEPDWRTDTLERPSVRAPVEPPSALTTPAPVRYPLYADEVGCDEAEAHVSDPPAAPAPDLDPAPYQGDEGDDRHRSLLLVWLPWVLVSAFLLLVALGGAWLLLSPGGDAGSDAAAAARSGPAESSEPETAAAESPSPSKKPSPSPSTSPSPSPSVPAGDPTDVAGLATARAPSTAPANQDIAGNRVTYVAANMLDGRADTCWRMPGDGTGTELSFTLAGPTRLNRVGLVNGYAKTALEGGRKLNWYVGNRRVLSATWVFDDGSTIDQPLGATMRMQTIDIPPVTTSTVRLRLVAVSSPGTGRSARDYTAVSEVTLVGVSS